MKLCMVSPQVRYYDYPRHVFLGQLQLLAILERDWKKVKFTYYDANAHRVDDFRRNKMHGLDEVLQSDDYDVFAIGGLITSYAYIKAAVKRARELQPHIKVVVGGGFFSAIPSDIMSLMPEIDYGVVGEAYVSFPELLSRIEAGEDVASVDGVVYRNHGDGELVFSQPRKLIPDMDWLPFPAYKYAPLDIYFRYSGLLLSEISMTAKKRLDANMSLGCPFACRFCWDLGITSNRRYRTDANGRIEVINGRPTKETIVRQHSPRYIAEYIRHLRTDYTDIGDEGYPNGAVGSGSLRGKPVDFIAWLDENIVAHDAQTGFTWLSSIEDELWRRDLIPECVQKGEKHSPDKHDCLHMGGTSHAGLATPKVLQTLKRIGFTYLDYGLESFSPEILLDLGKGASPQKNKDAIKLTMEAGIAPIPNQIVMFPLETWKTIGQMLDAWEETGIATVPFLCTGYPGSEWYETHKPFILEQYGGSLEAFLSDLEDATKVTALLNHQFTPAEAVGIQQILGAAAKTQDFANARRLLRLSEAEWNRRRGQEAS